MKKKKIIHSIITSLLIILFEPLMFAQQLKVISATKQDWAGGICCRHGVTYSIQLNLIQPNHKIILDTIWFHGFIRSLASYNPTKSTQMDSTHISIIETFVFDDGIKADYEFDETKKGVIISYRINRKKFMMNIDSYMRELEFIGYP